MQVPNRGNLPCGQGSTEENSPVDSRVPSPANSLTVWSGSSR